jgi:hypothetical protein
MLLFFQNEWWHFGLAPKRCKHHLFIFYLNFLFAKSIIYIYKNWAFMLAPQPPGPLFTCTWTVLWCSSFFFTLKKKPVIFWKFSIVNFRFKWSIETLNLCSNLFSVKILNVNSNLSMSTMKHALNYVIVILRGAYFCDANFSTRTSVIINVNRSSGTNISRCGNYLYFLQKVLLDRNLDH